MKKTNKMNKKGEVKMVLYTEDTIVKAYQKVYKRIVKAIDKATHITDTEKDIRLSQSYATLAALRHELGLDK